MMSSFISLAAGLAGAVALTVPDETPAPLAEAQVPDLTLVERAVPTLAATVADPLPTPPLIEVQGEAPATQAPAEGEAAPAESGLAVAQTAPQRSVISPPVTTEAPSPTEQRAILKAVSGALSAVETARGRFVQVDPAGRLTEGSFALRRPGRMRFDYDDPTPILIAADGATVAIRDDELETVDRVPLAATPLALLLDDDLDFERDAEVIEVRKAGGLVAVKMRDRAGEAEGELTLIFDAGSYELVAWRTRDANGGLTSVQLSSVQKDVSLDPRLFIIEEFEDEEDERR